MRSASARKIRFLLVYPLLAWLLLVAQMTERRLYLGIGLVALGALLRVWANGYVGHVKVNWTQKWRGDPKIGRLVTAGPYAFVRHPLYLGTFLIGAGFCLIAGNLGVSLAALGFFLIVYRRKMVQEETLLRDEIGTPYFIYQAAVPRWLPAWQRYPNRQGQWRWEGIVASREWKTLIWVFVAVLALYFREEIVQEHEFLPVGKPGEWLKHAVLLAAALVLILMDGAVELIARRKRAPRLPRTAG